MNINVVVLGGNLARDPELKDLPNSNTSVVNFTIAVNRQYKAKGDNQKKQETAFVNCEAWDTGAKTIAQYFKKGDPILVEGEVKQENWENTEGQKRSALKVRVGKFHFIAGHNYTKDESSEGGDDGPGFETEDDDNPF